MIARISVAFCALGVMSPSPAYDAELSSLGAQLAERLAESGSNSLAVLPLANQTGESDRFGSFAAQRLRVALASSGRPLDVASRAQSDRVLASLGSGDLTRIDPAELSQAASAVDVGVLVGGGYTVLSTRLALDVVVVDANSGNIVAGLTQSIPLGDEVADLLRQPAPEVSSSGPMNHYPDDPEEISAPQPAQTPAAPERAAALAESVSVAEELVPTNGDVYWTGRAQKGEPVAIVGGNASIGVVDGDLFPGTPIEVWVFSPIVVIDEQPHEGNDWKVLRFHLVKKMKGSASINFHWTSK